MPVLDAKALETDPKGAAFLLSVLRPDPVALKLQPNEVAPPRCLPQKVRMHFRATRRVKSLFPHMV